MRSLLAAGLYVLLLVPVLVAPIGRVKHVHAYLMEMVYRGSAHFATDMLVNVAEWCEDWYSPNYQRVVRGGSWVDSARSLRVSARGKATPTTRDYSIGVRLVRHRQ